MECIHWFCSVMVDSNFLSLYPPMVIGVGGYNEQQGILEDASKGHLQNE
jgi:hypothetical protein